MAGANGTIKTLGIVASVAVVLVGWSWIVSGQIQSNAGEIHTNTIRIKAVEKQLDRIEMNQVKMLDKFGLKAAKE